eukprot:g63083.t1
MKPRMQFRPQTRERQAATTPGDKKKTEKREEATVGEKKTTQGPPRGSRPQGESPSGSLTPPLRGNLVLNNLNSASPPQCECKTPYLS